MQASSPHRKDSLSNGPYIFYDVKQCPIELLNRSDYVSHLLAIYDRKENLDDPLAPFCVDYGHSVVSVPQLLMSPPHSG